MKLQQIVYGSFYFSKKGYSTLCHSLSPSQWEQIRIPFVTLCRNFGTIEPQKFPKGGRAFIGSPLGQEYYAIVCVENMGKDSEGREGTLGFHGFLISIQDAREINFDPLPLLDKLPFRLDWQKEHEDSELNAMEIAVAETPEQNMQKNFAMLISNLQEIRWAYAAQKLSSSKILYTTSKPVSLEQKMAFLRQVWAGLPLAIRMQKSFATTVFGSKPDFFDCSFQGGIHLPKEPNTIQANFDQPPALVSQHPLLLSISTKDFSLFQQYLQTEPQKTKKTSQTNIWDKIKEIKKVAILVFIAIVLLSWLSLQGRNKDNHKIVNTMEQKRPLVDKTSTEKPKDKKPEDNKTSGEKPKDKKPEDNTKSTEKQIEQTNKTDNSIKSAQDQKNQENNTQNTKKEGDSKKIEPDSQKIKIDRHKPEKIEKQDEDTIELYTKDIDKQWPNDNKPIVREVCELYEKYTNRTLRNTDHWSILKMVKNCVTYIQKALKEETIKNQNMITLPLKDKQNWILWEKASKDLQEFYDKFPDDKFPDKDDNIKNKNMLLEFLKEEQKQKEESEKKFKVYQEFASQFQDIWPEKPKDKEEMKAKQDWLSNFQNNINSLSEKDQVYANFLNKDVFPYLESHFKWKESQDSLEKKSKEAGELLELQNRLFSSGNRSMIDFLGGMRLVQEDWSKEYKDIQKLERENRERIKREEKERLEREEKERLEREEKERLEREEKERLKRENRMREIKEQENQRIKSRNVSKRSLSK